MTVYLKEPAARLDYSIDWAPGHLAGAAISLSQWSVSPEEPGGAAVDAASLLGNRASAVISGGVPGRVYQISNRVTLSDGRVDERSITLRTESR